MTYYLGHLGQIPYSPWIPIPSAVEACSCPLKPPPRLPPSQIVPGTRCPAKHFVAFLGEVCLCG